MFPVPGPVGPPLHGPPGPFPPNPGFHGMGPGLPNGPGFGHFGPPAHGHPGQLPLHPGHGQGFPAPGPVGPPLHGPPPGPSFPGRPGPGGPPDQHGPDPGHQAAILQHITNLANMVAAARAAQHPQVQQAAHDQAHAALAALLAHATGNNPGGFMRPVDPGVGGFGLIPGPVGPPVQGFPDASDYARPASFGGQAVAY